MIKLIRLVPLAVIAALNIPLIAQNVGIGTTAPEELLHIKNGHLKIEDHYSLKFNGAFNDTTGIRFYTNDIDWGGILYDASDRAINITKDESEIGMYFDLQSGRILIGRKQQVSLAEKFGISFETTGSGFGGMYIDADGVDGPAFGKPFYGYSTGGLGRAFHYFDEADDSWKLNVGGDRMNVKRINGFVGLNLADPLERLHVGGNIRMENTIPTLSFYQAGLQAAYIQQNVDQMYVRNVESGDLYLGTNNANQLKISASDITAYQDLRLDGIVRSLIFNTGGTDKSKLEQNGFNLSMATLSPTGRLYFKTNNSTRMMINEDGKVGIGTISPDGMLDVAGSLITDTLGIGLDPDVPLHVSGAIRSEASTPIMQWFAGSTYKGYISAFSTDFIVANPQSGNLKFRTNNTDRMHLTPNGSLNVDDWTFYVDAGNDRVGIGLGIQLPTRTLDVGGKIRVRDSVDPEIRIDNNGANVTTMKYLASHFIVSNESLNGTLDFHTDNTERMRISYNGDVRMDNHTLVVDASEDKVGIGTSSPDEKLHILDGNVLLDNVTPAVKLAESGALKGHLEVSSGDLRLRTEDLTDAIEFVQSNTVRMVIQQDGDIVMNNSSLFVDVSENNVGIGTITPSADLDVAGSLEVDGLTFKINDNTNQVMMGTNIPATGYLLSVKGKIMAEELKVQLYANWPDYVFDENYDLMSIKDIELFINRHGHLPGIPSAKEIEMAQGVELGEMNRLLLEKIEEMTLHMIEQQNQINTLMTIVDQLKSQAE